MRTVWEGKVWHDLFGAYRDCGLLGGLHWELDWDDTTMSYEGLFSSMALREEICGHRWARPLLTVYMLCTANEHQSRY